MDLKVPNIAQGKTIPSGIEELFLKEAKEKQLRKEQYRHNYLVALISSTIGGIVGFICSIIYSLCTK